VELPIHRDHRKPGLNAAVLRVDGLVEQCQLTSADLQRLLQRDVRKDFTCLEGWTVPDVA